MRKIAIKLKRCSHIGIMSADFQHKLDIVVEGQQMVAEKLEFT